MVRNRNLESPQLFSAMKIHSLSDLKFLKPSTLRSWFSGKGKFAVVDVRDADYIGGHIKGCLHYPSGNFHEKLPELRQRLMENGVDDVVFHCALSQVRGPKATLVFLRSLDNLKDEAQIKYFEHLNVWVLQGGFTSWQRKYGEDVEVTEGFQKDLWD